MATKSSAAPLVSLDAVVLDTETTGPDAANARLIQIGAVRFVKGRVREQESLQVLVDPGEPIPESSTRIHGISDKDVAGAADFAAAYSQLADFAGDAIIIGHSIGFDLAVLKRECALAGIAWRRPRTLDTRLLGRIARPMLNDFSLDTLAGWLGHEIENRHSALGDALATAHVFIGLLPHLREKQVRTLAEAEAASRTLTEELMNFQSAGWEDPVSASAMDAMRPLARIDSYPYRHRVRDVMSAPPVHVDAGTTLAEISVLLIERRISSVFVRAGGETGIVTERDVLRVLADKGAAALEMTAGEIMSRPLQTVRAGAFIYRAIARMDRLDLRHLGVVDERDNLVGALTSRNLLRQRASAALALGDEIDFAEDAAALAVAWAHLPAMAEQLIGEDVDARDIAAVISREVCAITRRASELAEDRMKTEGKGAPPARYAVLVLGSAGRGESLLAADQDNAIVYEDGAGEEVDAWFAELGAHMADILDTAGIPYCNGGVMARNEQWRHDVSGWKAVVDEWIRRSRPEDLLNVDIFYDLTPVHGAVALGEEVRAYAFEKAAPAPDFAKLLADSSANFHPPIGLFGGLKTQEGRLDLKRSGLLPVVTAARVLAIRHGVMAHSTPERLSGIRDLGLGSQAEFDHLIHAHGVVVRAILRQQIADLHAGNKLSNRIETGKLGKEETAELKDSLAAMGHTGRMVHDLLFAEPHK
jgi:DNA polymerase-3 subunit epsilon/CBS domain-containing protein